MVRRLADEILGPQSSIIAHKCQVPTRIFEVNQDRIPPLKQSETPVGIIPALSAFPKTPGFRLQRMGD